MEEQKMKKVISLLLALAMVFALCACGGAKNDDAFLKNLQKGIEKRISVEEKISQNGSARFSPEALTSGVSEELNAIGSLSDYTFADAELEALAEAYVAALNNQVAGGAQYTSNYTAFIDTYYSKGYYPQMQLLCTIYDDYGLEIKKKSLEKFNAFLDDGRYYSELQNVISGENVVFESLGGSRSLLIIENTTGHDLSGAQISFNFYDDAGVMVGSSSTYFQSWLPGVTNKAEIYSQNTYAKAEAEISLYGGSSGISTGYFPLNYINEMIIELELVTELPKEFSYKSYSKCEVNNFWYEDNYWNDGAATLTLHISGEKTFDRNGESGTESCYLKWKICDEDGVVIDTGSFYTSDLTVGQAFKDSSSSARNLTPGKYFMEIMDYS